MLEVYDANGNRVEAGSAVFCNRCGAYIKHIFEFEGKPYGSTCIEAVSGIRPSNWVYDENRYSHSKTLQSMAQQEESRQAQKARDEALNALREGIRAENARRYSEIINTLRGWSNGPSDFCSDMARQIETDGFSNELDEIFSWRQLCIVREIWGKANGGRRGSRAYKAAVNEFDEKFMPEEAE